MKRLAQPRKSGNPLDFLMHAEQYWYAETMPNNRYGIGKVLLTADKQKAEAFKELYGIAMNLADIQKRYGYVVALNLCSYVCLGTALDYRKSLYNLEMQRIEQNRPIGYRERSRQTGWWHDLHSVAYDSDGNPM